MAQEDEKMEQAPPLGETTGGGPVKTAQVLEFEGQFDRAAENSNVDEACKALKQIIDRGDVDWEDEDIVKIKERSIYKLAELYAKANKVTEIAGLLKSIRPMFDKLTKAKTAKVVRTLINRVGDVPDSVQSQVDLCLESIAWCKAEKRNFLRNRIELRLSQLYLTRKEYQKALKLLAQVIREVKRLDDKQLLVELFLTESQIQEALRNSPKAKASLVACRANAASIYVVPALQAQIDMQAGLISADEKDFKTAFSYFFEAFEGYNSLNTKDKAGVALKYMLLTKIMMNKPQDVDGIIRGKMVLSYAGPAVDAMKAVSTAYKKRSVHELKLVLASKHKEQIANDRVIQHHLTELKSSLLEQNLLKILEPYSRVELSRVAELINLDVSEVEQRISQMILDGTFRGILDQGNNSVVVFEDEPVNESYKSAIDTIEQLEGAADQLFLKAKKLSGR